MGRRGHDDPRVPGGHDALKYSECRSSSRPPVSRSAAAAKSSSTRSRAGGRGNVMGLVEVGVGLIPAGAAERRDAGPRDGRGAARGDPLPLVQRVFETIGFARSRRAGRCAPAWISSRFGRYLDDRRPLWKMRKRSPSRASLITCVRSRARRSRSAAAVSSRAEARHSPGVASRPHQRSRCAHWPETGVDSGRWR